MKTNVIWSDSAIKDINNILDYIELDNPGASYAIYMKIKERLVFLETNPKIGRILPELDKLDKNNYREIVYRRWRIIYRINDSLVRIIAIIDSRRDINLIIADRLKV